MLDLFKLATPREISYVSSFTSLGGNYLVSHFRTFCFLRYVFISTAIASVWLSSLTSMGIEARIPVIWSYLLPLICTPASLCSSSASLQVISSCSQRIFHRLVLISSEAAPLAGLGELPLAASSAPLLSHSQAVTWGFSLVLSSSPREPRYPYRACSVYWSP